MSTPSTTLSPPSAPSSRARSALSMGLSFLNIFILVSALTVMTTEAFAPEFKSEKLAEKRRVIQLSDPQKMTYVSRSGGYYQTHQVYLKTADNRTLQADYMSSATLPDHPVPLTVVVPELTASRIDMASLLPDLSGSMAIVYTSPRGPRMSGPLWPSFSDLLASESPDDVFRSLTTNPLTYFYSLKMGLYEAPYDITTLVEWAKENLSADMHRLQLVGIGSGALVATIAAERLQMMGIMPSKIALIYPPADLKDSIKDVLIERTPLTRASVAAITSFFLRDLELKRHLPNLRSGQLLILEPEHALELSRFSSTPAESMVSPSLRTTVMTLEHAYLSLTDPSMIEAARSTVQTWLKNQKGAP